MQAQTVRWCSVMVEGWADMPKFAGSMLSEDKFFCCCKNRILDSAYTAGMDYYCKSILLNMLRTM